MNTENKRKRRKPRKKKTESSYESTFASLRNLVPSTTSKDLVEYCTFERGRSRSVQSSFAFREERGHRIFLHLIKNSLFFGSCVRLQWIVETRSHRRTRCNGLGLFQWQSMGSEAGASTSKRVATCDMSSAEFEGEWREGEIES